MRRYSIILFCALGTLNCFGQYEGLSDFYEKMYYTKQIMEFVSTHGVPLKDKRYVSRLDTTRVNTLYTLNFDKHPNLDKSSKGGRFEMFNSILADSTSVYQVTQRLYINFETTIEGKMYLDNLVSKLRPISWKTEAKKTDTFEEFTFFGDEFRDLENGTKKFITCDVCFIVLRLTQNKQTNESELFIGQ